MTNKIRFRETRLPNFFVVGAARAGTTSLHYFLSMHPKIFMCPKEPNYFIFDVEEPDFDYPDKEGLIKHSILDKEQYLGLFRGSDKFIAIGEVSPLYLYSTGAASRIRQVCGEDVKIVAVLRDPVDRAYSHLCRHYSALGYPPGYALEALIRHVRDDANDLWVTLAINLGLYYKQIKRYIDVFGRNRVRVYKYEDLSIDGQAVLLDLLRFIGVEAMGLPTLPALNSASQRRFPILRDLKPLLRKTLPLTVYNKLVYSYHKLLLHLSPRQFSPLPLYLRRMLLERYYMQDIIQLEALLQINIRGWRVDG